MLVRKFAARKETLCGVFLQKKKRSAEAERDNK